MTLADRLTGIRVLCIGDAMLDRFVTGEVRRISPESPVPVLSISATHSYPGGAANVARNVASLGGRCTVVGVIGDDPAGAELAHLLRGIDGVECAFVVDRARPTSEKIRFTAQGQHMLRADAELSAPIDEPTARQVIATLERLAPEHDVLILSDYAKGVLTDGVIRAAVGAAHALGLPVAVDPKSADLKRYAGATVITPNSREVHAAVGIDPTDEDAAAERAGRAILTTAGIGAVLLTRAHRGVTLVDGVTGVMHVPASAREVYDVVGAGDTVIATLSMGLGAKLTLTDAARLANAAAGIVVGKAGTATATQTELADELSRFQFGSLQGLESKIVSRREAVELAATWRRNGLTVGFTNGCFDILHVGHLAILGFSKQHCGKLIVGLNSDASVRRLKAAGRPINPEHDRAMVLAALSVVDAVVVFDEDTPLGLITHLGPDVLVKGADYALDAIVGAAQVLARGGRVLRCELVAGRSTSKVVDQLRGGPPTPSA